MDIGPGDDTLRLRDNVREVLAAECPPDLARQAITDPQCWQGLWKSVVDLGWTSLAGDEFAAIDLAVVLEECGAAIAPIPMLTSVGLAAGALKVGGPAFDQALADIAVGTVTTLAAQAAGARLPGAPMRLEHGRLRGHAVGVADLIRAEFVVTLAVSDDTPVVAVVRINRDTNGDTVIDETESVDPSRPLADLTLDAVPEAVAPVNLDAALTIPLLAAAAELVGVAAASLHRAVEHAKTRNQFGKPIGSFQGVKHALANNYVLLERARSLTYAAAAQVDDPTTSAGQCFRAAALAKAAAGDAAASCTRAAVQTHGALAQTWEHDMHLYVRRAWQGAALLGDSRSLYHVIGCDFVTGEA